MDHVILGLTFLPFPIVVSVVFLPYTV
jgi:hypothetical protein